MMDRLVKRVSRTSLAWQIAAMALFLSLLFPLFSGYLNQQIYNRMFLTQAKASLMRTLVLVENNIDNTIGLIDDTSQALIASESISDIMETRTFTEDIEARTEAINFIRNVLDNTSYVSSVHLFNNYGNVMNVGINMINTPHSSDVTKASWYESVSEKRGYYELLTDTQEFFISQSDMAFVSMARQYNDINTQKNEGILVINVASDTLAASFEALVGQYDTRILIADSQGTTIIDDGSGAEPQKLIKAIQTNENGFIRRQVDGRDYITTYKTNEYGWYIIGSLDTGNISRQLEQNYQINTMFLLLTGILIFTGISIFVKYRTDVIKIIIRTMNDTSSGKLEHAKVPANSQDIRELRNGYNTMADEINSLIDQVRYEEELKSKIHFNALQSQINPHFLYNTLDSISSLALMGDTKLAYEVTSALGNYYRTNLSKGKDIITLDEEIEATRNYLRILEIRYGDEFEVCWDIDYTQGKIKVPKLLLQPFVENAIYHGIRPKGDVGVLTLSVIQEESKLVITILDNGVGMTEEKIAQILTDDAEGFGVSSTVKRLSIYYRDAARVTIKSNVGKGTRIQIDIPLDMGV